MFAGEGGEEARETTESGVAPDKKYVLRTVCYRYRYSTIILTTTLINYSYLFI